MSSCLSIDPLVTPYVDGELSPTDRAIVEEHVRRCAPCYSRVTAEAAVRDLLHVRRSGLTSEQAPPGLHARCDGAARQADGAPVALSRAGVVPSPLLARVAARVGGFAPLAVAASLVVLVAGAFLYQATHYSARLLAAELAADHVKCFAASRLFGTREEAAAVKNVESSMMSAFGWRLHLPEQFDASGMELVGSRRCLYAEGRVAHLMYRDERGRPISIFMLPKRSRPEELVEVLGHEAAIWSSGDRTFVLVTRGSPDEVRRMASFVKAALQ
jgi:anti-sigma factor RsiW